MTPGLHTRNALHEYVSKQAPTMDRTHRTLKDAGWPDELTDDDYHPEACIVWGIGALVVVVVLAVLAWRAWA